jgi:hypothetical protein
VAHRFLNTGDRPMRILWNSTSVEVTRTFVDTGETVTHMAAGETGGIRAEAQAAAAIRPACAILAACRLGGH